MNPRYTVEVSVIGDPFYSVFDTHTGMRIENDLSYETANEKVCVLNGGEVKA